MQTTNGENNKAISVVLADDQAVARIGVRQLLKEVDGIVVVGEANSGVEALRLVTNLNPDVLLLEVKLPDLSGIEVFNKLQEIDSTTRVLILSAYDDALYMKWLLESNIGGYLSKRVDPSHLIEGIRGVAQGEEGWLSPGVARKIMELKKREAALDSFRLTPREKGVLTLLLKGYENSEIANALFVSTGTIKNHLTNIYEKLGVKTRTEAIIWAYHQELL